MGSIRPSNDGKFKWNDGIVIQAMKLGKKLLIDEISLALDSVLERLNSLFETDRSILLMDGIAESEVIIAEKGFQIIATMNPGDDYGKKEVIKLTLTYIFILFKCFIVFQLSKALRNRFMEIWCSGEQLSDDMQAIIEKRMIVHCNNKQIVQKASSCFVRFFEYFRNNFSYIFKYILFLCTNLLKFLFRTMITIRDLINMSELFSNCLKLYFSPANSFFHSLYANLFDSFGIISARISYDRNEVIEKCLEEVIFKKF